jgi:hypothetical protein
MINLLPDNEKNNVNHEYKLRRLALWLIASLTIVGIMIILMVPLYSLARYKSWVITSNISTSTPDSDIEGKDLQAQIQDAKLLVSVLKPNTENILPTAIIDMLVKNKTEFNTITSIRYSLEESGTTTVVVQGIAKTRESLSYFTDALKHEPQISQIDVPVSNFAKDANIKYTFTLTAQH